MSDYQKAVEALDSIKCPTCGGLGKCNDADFGDIYYNEWVCKACEGTGLRKEDK